MPLYKITKRTIRGSLLVQFKTAETSSWLHSESSNQYSTVGGLTPSITPLYINSILETNCSMTLRDSQGASNTHDTYSIALYVNGNVEYTQTEIMGHTPYGNTHTAGGRNDRVSPTAQHGHVTSQAQPVSIIHAFRPNSTNRVTFEVKMKNNGGDRDLLVQDFFFIIKELGVSDETLVQQNNDPPLP